ncbi:MAG TPA: carbamoyltransferase HypF, partial [bacterium (Candidatus Stahlbacteria)]|nr:carbamoyltransferase HypF [Candidatus Stahlbacteria bacterium]
MQRLKLTVKGIVQGVGFRPFIYSLAKKYALNGFVLNNTEGVEIEVEGEHQNLREFIKDIRRASPPISSIEAIEETQLPFFGYKEFVIKESAKKDASSLLISPDIATCDDCLRELFDPKDRRLGYPFINCTNCGPRFTIIKDIPYDRPRTTMSKFVMCKDCREEYENPQNRRFHAQPNACHVCGPKIFLIDRAGKEIRGNPIKETVRLLKQGKIVAIKGLGGFHLACDASNYEVVARLRQRKYREDKPLAIMVRDLNSIREVCQVSKEEAKLLCSPRRPIVLLKKRHTRVIAENVTPNNNYLGVMLPYTPVHTLIMRESNLFLIMTSGNISDEPIIYENDVAIEKLNSIADYFLLNDRDIHTRCDDSVARIFKNKEMLLRRSRGYVPYPIKLAFNFDSEIIATGAHLKNTFCLGRENYAFLSHHIGDLENVEALKAFEQGIEHFKHLFYIKPKIIAYDLHPRYLSTQYALSIEGVRKIGVQHHFAHIASCLAENKVSDKVIGVAFDGTGYGLDGRIWGGEFIIGNLKKLERVGHFKYVGMPGGEVAIKEPWRMALTYLLYAFGDDADKFKEFDAQKFELLKKGINAPLTSSVGRLFDGISSILGIRDFANYEGQPAIALEMVSDESVDETYQFELQDVNGMIIVDPKSMILQLVKDRDEGKELSEIGGKFHNFVRDAILKVCSILRNKYSINKVALSGGVFQNMLLL